MITSLETAMPYALAAFIVAAFLAFFVPPLLSTLRASRRSAAQRAPHYLNLCGSRARPNTRLTGHRQAA